jgi:predicted NAD-dependent protein-ADP-ribosyltransferase YbiA (DUF1768 family)
MTYFYSDEDENYYLSNFFPQPFKTGGKWKPLKILHEGLEYPTSEHLYQALKFKNETLEEKEWREVIRTANTPLISKYLGHQDTYVKYAWHKKYKDLVVKYKDIVRPAGDVNDMDFRLEIMKIAVSAKFKSHPELLNKLQQTTGLLGENSTDVWGIHGKNYLGLILMEVRDSL